jgi:flagellar FliL protein
MALVSDSTPLRTVNPKPSILRVLSDAFIATAIAASIGCVFAIARPSQPSPQTMQNSAEKPTAGTRDLASIVDLPPIVANLGTPSDTWIRVELSIVFDGATAPGRELQAAEISGDTLAYLRTLSLTQIEGPIGLQNLRADLNDRAKTRSGGSVREVIIRTLVVQ